MRNVGHLIEDFLTKLGFFSSTLFVTAMAVYIYSPVIGSHADESATSEVSATINPVISVALDTSDISFSLIPTSLGVFESKPITATVDTNSAGGYELYFSSEDNETNMINSLPNITSVVASDFTGTVTESTMAANKWGYSLNNKDFSKIPVLNAQATLRNIDHNPSTAERITPVNIGMKIDASLSSGMYSKGVVFSALAHEELSSLDPVIGSTMQSFTCSELSKLGDSTVLTDTRDGNRYTVKKLADGNCWMTENLRLIDKTISSADSNLSEGETYTVPASNLSNFTESYDANSAYLDSTYGAYYTFYTATAGTGGTSLATDGANAPSSICPKGWRLPTGGSSGEFNTLYEQYNSVDLMMGIPGFTLSGSVNRGSVNYQGSYGEFWSSTVYDGGAIAYGLYLYNYGVLPETRNSKNFGFSVRCVAEGTKDTADTEDTEDRTISDITYMQDMTSKIVENTPIDTVATLTDIRDNNTYTVRKLKDGKIWMTQNLRLINKAISGADSNLPEGETYTVPASNLSSFTTSHNTSNAYLDSTYGGYYNFYTATAGWGTNSVTSGDSPKDICPKGWRLPTGGSSGEFQMLYNNYKSSALMQGDPNFTLSGSVLNRSERYQGSEGIFWSSTVNNANIAYDLYLDSSSVSPENSNNKIYGSSVRCVAEGTVDTADTEDPDDTKDTEGTEDRTISDITNMQDMTSKIAENTPIDTVATLTDTRDNNTYTVRKLKDGKIWMTQNLRIINKTISSADSNLPSGETWTIPASSTSGFNSYNVNNAYLDSTYGGYYTFKTATAGTDTGLTSGDAPGSICPKGWRLPTGGSSGEFQDLYYYYNLSGLMQGDPNFTLSGRVRNKSVLKQGETGNFWSSTIYDTDYAYELYLSRSKGRSKVYPDHDSSMNFGYSLRCIAQ